MWLGRKKKRRVEVKKIKNKCKGNSSLRKHWKLGGAASWSQRMALYAPETSPGGRKANPDLSRGRESQTESAYLRGKPSDHLTPAPDAERNVAPKSDCLVTADAVPAETILCDTNRERNIHGRHRPTEDIDRFDRAKNGSIKFVLFRLILLQFW